MVTTPTTTLFCSIGNKLLSHAEVFKDISEYFVGGYLAACDFGEGVECEAKVFGKEIATESVVEAVEYTLKMFVGASQGIVMAGWKR